MNIDKIIKKIKELFKFKFVYNKNILFNLIRGNRNYSNNQIYQALDIIINDTCFLFKISGSTDDLSDIKLGLTKWQELKDFC